MSWLKRFISKFVNEEIDEQEQPREMDNTRRTSSTMETRMTYQYPKGNFRFPLMQDPPDKQVPPNKGTPKSDYRERNERKYERSSMQKTEMEHSKNKVQHEKVEKPKNKKVESQLKQPFRPSHIPSPIFGYQRPKKNSTEYELQDSFLKNNENKIKPENSLNTEEQETVLPLTFLTPETETELQLDEKTTREPELFLHPVIEEADEELEPISDEIEMEAEEGIASSEPIIEGEPVEEPSFAEIEDEKPEESIELEQEQTSVEQDSSCAEEEPSRPAKRETTRAAMPFNVLMLKNDRKSLRERQEKKREQPLIKKEYSQPALQERAEELESRAIETVKHTKERETPQRPPIFLEDEQEEALETYNHPALSLLQPPVSKVNNKEWLEEQKVLLSETLANFNVQAQVVQVSQGPSVTRFEVQPERGVKVNKITNLSDDIKLSMAARDIRMEAPIPGKRTIGIEIPNQDSRPVQLSEIIGDPSFLESESPLTAALGLDISGNSIVTDLQKMPHGLIAGATGSGKSVCINSILVSLLYKASPDELKLLLIDPKMVELAPYNHIPHLVSPVITDVKAATASLKWAVEEMERRYELFAHASVRNIGRFNELAEENRRFNEKLPYIVIIIDELADLMMMAPHDVEESICRIAQKARACGIHLIIATQRPSVDVITGLIKANVPTRIAFSVSSQVDSRTIIDISGAEKLLGRGDMLFLGSGSSKPVRLQGTFVSDGEIDRVIEHVRAQGEPDYLFEQEELLKKTQVQEEEDELYFASCEFVMKQGSASTSMIQRQFRIGYNRAARLIDMMEQQGVISAAKGSKPRDVLMTESEWESLQETIS
ncbi:DNA translocase FtsK [Bacillus sp. SD088]|uniref:DNA translocase FtsK n=1 Tax=Bacillus sp. SD088 TaxID=2782012 RepID=UPI001A976614|nr:DNA translocase FtsK [Bacillus sp. SD088]MBO0992394.1 DNA translocase FtsK [Bacillus sp. SD088]